MIHPKARLSVFLFCLLTLLGYSFATGQQLALQGTGDNHQGYHVVICNQHQIVVANTEEFSLQLNNHDLTKLANMPPGIGQKWTRNERHITGQREMDVKEFDANLSANIICEVVNDHLIKKAIELYQPSMPDILFKELGFVISGDYTRQQKKNTGISMMSAGNFCSAKISTTSVPSDTWNLYNVFNPAGDTPIKSSINY